MRVRVLMAHNYYQQAGGEDQSFLAESALLEASGHQVVPYTVHNQSIDSSRRLRAGAQAVWSTESHRALRALVRETRPDVAHFQNIFPLISPSAYYAVKAEGVPIVQSLRNYRLACPTATFFRDGHPCEDCRGKLIPWPGVVHACYRNSRPATAAVGAMLLTHRLLGTWQRMVDVYVALTTFTEQKLRSTLPHARMVVKPNFVYPDPGPGPGGGGESGAVFVGRLSQEKGIDTLLEAWRGLAPAVPLRVIGDGPLAPQVAQAQREIPGVTWLGRLSSERTFAELGKADLLVFPSLWYETFGRVAVEAFAKGTPVLASDLGAVAEVTRQSPAGMLFPPGDAVALRERVAALFADRGELTRLRPLARQEFELKYSGAANLGQLLEIYRLAAEEPGQPG